MGLTVCTPSQHLIRDSLMVGLQHSESQFPHPSVGLISSFWGIPPSECCVAVQGQGGPQTQRLLSMFFLGGAIRK